MKIVKGDFIYLARTSIECSLIPQHYRSVRGQFRLPWDVRDKVVAIEYIARLVQTPTPLKKIPSYDAAEDWMPMGVNVGCRSSRSIIPNVHTNLHISVNPQKDFHESIFMPVYIGVEQVLSGKA
ncbi:hypothetical protein [Pseudarthrobacter sp. BRE9]|uniref:hypothetical protein n=1 Tax=Pseudarthrobacter sp. BRE9 TaxID=2962582 RepID=UPI002882C535|nr:hypothetical protein [Pseudarthrobacter sp. BRE9]MDT0169451.1 hypothetical protein [Pseudarthrobacter sp. BRE9]